MEPRCVVFSFYGEPPASYHFTSVNSNNFDHNVFYNSNGVLVLQPTDSHGLVTDLVFVAPTYQNPRREFLNSGPLLGATSIVNEERDAKVEIMSSSLVSEGIRADS